MARRIPWIGQSRIDVRGRVVIVWEFGVSRNSRVGRPDMVAHGESSISMRFCDGLLRESHG